MTRITAALAARQAKLGKKDEGFTLIELLVVVIIIGILAAIAIPVYIGVQNSAKDSAVKSDLENAKTAVVAYFTQEGSYPAEGAATLTGIDLDDYGYPGPSLTYKADADEPKFVTANSATGEFCIQATSPTGDTNDYHVDQSGGVKDGECNS